ncbi:hypothetical protein QOZ80_6BG0483380 [Eleusine coracana subsp. coracana]|nr:hypothetical protein QOZ80_6BG0483380 [Eleusine coracana subsp. coracana]
MAKPKPYVILCIFCISILGLIALAGVLIVACSDASSVATTVEEASLGRLALSVSTGGGNNRTAPPSSLSYNISVTIAVRNGDWLGVWRTAPLDAELRLGERPFGLVQLAGTERDLIRPMRKRLYHLAAAAESAAVALGSDEVAEFARESAAGLFRLELVVAGGGFVYKPHLGRSLHVMVACPLRIPLSTAAMAKAYARFEQTLPQACVDPSKSRTK